MRSETESLELAFPPHPLDPTDAFSEWGATYTDAEAFRAGVRGHPWNALRAEFLEHSHDALVFLGKTSIGDYLPAFLSAVMRRDPALSALPSFLFGILTRGSDIERFDARFANLTPAQRKAIAHALNTFESELEGSAHDATDVLDAYWRLHLERGVSPREESASSLPRRSARQSRVHCRRSRASRYGCSRCVLATAPGAGECLHVRNPRVRIATANIATLPGSAPRA